MEVTASENQQKLFNLIAEFSVDTVVAFIANAYKKYGPTVVSGDSLPELIINFAQEYFNNCARWIYDRSDDYINNKFSIMSSVVLEGKNEPIDILHIVVMLSLNLLQEMNIRDVVTRDYMQTMTAVKIHLRAIIKRHAGLAAYLSGCTPDHIHEPIGPDENVFSFAYDKYVAGDDGSAIKLSDLEC